MIAQCQNRAIIQGMFQERFDKQMRCVIFGAGEYGNYDWKREGNDYVIAADGGLDELLKRNSLPNVLIGDMDSTVNESSMEKLREQGVEIKKLPREKDDTDMLAAIKLGLEMDCEEFVIYGGIGGRLDHTIANIQCLIYLKNRGKRAYLIGEKSITEIIRNERKTFPKQMHGIFSAFAIGTEAKGVTESGFKYEVTRAVIQQEFPIGISNEFTGQESYIEVEDGTLLLHVIETE